MADYELIEVRASEECGCPEEFYLYRGVDLTIHLKEDGSMHGFMDWGDRDAQRNIRASSFEDGRAQLLAWAASMTQGPER